jgi:hypothetical protein
MHIKGIHDTVANAILRLDFSLIIDNKADWMMLIKCCCHHTEHIDQKALAIAKSKKF